MKVPKILPWLANRAGISEDLALELWRCAAREAEMSIADCDSSDLPDLPQSNTDHGPDIMIRASILKGWFYAGATGLLLCLLVARLLDALNASHQREIDNYREMQRTHPLSCQL